jgi:succinate dehydrogenase flavin-adding protein (antitoxin of CptAB toxin-antitoxin module)
MPINKVNMDKVLLLSQEGFKNKILTKIDEFENTFFASILDLGDQDLLEPRYNYRTSSFMI